MISHYSVFKYSVCLLGNNDVGLDEDSSSDRKYAFVGWFYCRVVQWNMWSWITKEQKLNWVVAINIM